MPTITIKRIKAAYLSEIPFNQLDQSVVVSDFDLTVKYPNFIGNARKGALLRGGNKTLALMQRIKEQAWGYYLATAASPSRLSMDSLEQEMQRVYCQDVQVDLRKFFLTKRDPIQPVYQLEKDNQPIRFTRCYLEDNVILNGYEKAAGTVLKIKQDTSNTKRISQIYFIDDFIANAFFYPEEFKIWLYDIKDKLADNVTIYSVWLDPSYLLKGNAKLRDIVLSGSENSELPDYVGLKDFFVPAKTPAERETECARNVLVSTIRSSHVHQILTEVTALLRAQVLTPIKEAIATVKSYDDLSPVMQKALRLLAVYNLDHERFFGSVISGFHKVEEILSSIDNIKLIVNTTDDILAMNDDIHDISDVLTILQTIADMTSIYYTHFSHSDEFTKINHMIWPTAEEDDNRVTWQDRGFEAQYAITRGVGMQTGVDVVPKRYGFGMPSGKSLYAGVSKENRLKAIVTEYDNLISERDFLLNLLTLAEDSHTRESLTRLETKLQTAIQRMQFYKIPLLPQARKSLIEYANQFESSLEKLAKQYNLPLVANLSHSTARTLITLQDLNAFTHDGQFSLDKAQIIGNLLMGFYVYEGHHSFSEVGEIFNRLLDYVALERAEQLPSNQRIEAAMPYYRAGDYDAFIHPTLAIDAPLNRNTL